MRRARSARGAPGRKGQWHMIELRTPSTLTEACQLLYESGGEAMAYAGGTAIQILRKQGVLFASRFVDLAEIPGLARIERVGDTLRIGAMVTHRQVECDPLIAEAAPLLPQTYRHVANIRVRNTATVGGNLAHGDYRLDPPAALLTLGASVELVGVEGISRILPLRDFFVDFQQTAIQPGQVLVAIHVPVQPPLAGAAFVKFSSLGANDWPCAGAAALLTASNETGGEEITLRLGLTALGPTPIYREVSVRGLSRTQTLEQADALVVEAIDPLPDLRGSVAYKRRVARVIVADAVTTAWEERTR